MQHYAAFATFTTCNPVHTEEWKPKTVATYNTFPYMPYQCRTGNTSSKSTANSKHIGTMQTKIAFIKKFRTNLTREICAGIWSYVLSSCLLSALRTRGYVMVLFESLLW